MNEIKKCLVKAKGKWVEEILSVVWSYTTTPWANTKETPFSLVFEIDVVLPPELLTGSIRTIGFSQEASDNDLHHNLDLLDEKREKAQLNQVAYMCHVEKYYNKCMQGRDMKVGYLVLRANEVSHSEPRGKLGPTW